MIKSFACLVAPLLLAPCIAFVQPASDGRGFSINPKCGGRVY